MAVVKTNIDIMAETDTQKQGQILIDDIQIKINLKHDRDADRHYTGLYIDTDGDFDTDAN